MKGISQTTARRLAVILIGAGMALFILQWFLVPKMSIFQWFISEFAIVPYGTITAAGFCVVGAGVGLSSGIISAGGAVSGRHIPELINLTYGFLVILLAFFPTDPHGMTSVIGTIHRIIASVAFPGFAAGYALVFIAAGNYGRRITELVLVGLMLAAFYIVTRNDYETRGLYQRIFIFSQFVLVILLLGKNKLMGNGV